MPETRHLMVYRRPFSERVAVPVFDATVHTQMLMSAILRTQEQLVFPLIVDILVGEATPDLVEKYRLDELPTYGVGKDTNRFAWRAIADP